MSILRTLERPFDGDNGEQIQRSPETSTSLIDMLPWLTPVALRRSQIGARRSYLIWGIRRERLLISTLDDFRWSYPVGMGALCSLSSAKEPGNWVRISLRCRVFNI